MANAPSEPVEISPKVMAAHHGMYSAFIALLKWGAIIVAIILVLLYLFVWS